MSNKPEFFNVADKAFRLAEEVGVAYIRVDAKGDADVVHPKNVIITPVYGEECAHVWQSELGEETEKCVYCGLIRRAYG